ncbi:MAG: asparagine synthase (glutamine-hydrolyzing) [bacterium]
MCGIAGIYGVSDEATVGRMINVQSHRGPDGSGIWNNQEIPVTLGHCRLSIIDLSPEGHQPMSYANGRLWIAFNGEIYNFKELRSELEALGCRFYSNSDTEVILAAYLKWGRDSFKRLRGMFAFALVDRYPSPGCPELILVRDRLGIKPLLYYENASQLFFASELRGLLENGWINREIDPDALLDYLAVGAVFQPKTIIKGIKAIPAGHWMEVCKNKKRFVKYWDLHEETAELRKELRNVCFHEASERLKIFLQDAARYNLVSDVPVGAFLSGGIDSTAVVGLMSAVSGRKIKTFSVGFENTHSAIDERKYARIAADYLKSEHEEIVITSNDASKIFEKIVTAIDQPSIDGTNTWIISHASRYYVKVCVSGLGGDELFAGYTHFRWLAEDKKLISNPNPIIYNLLEKTHKLRPNFITLRLLFKLASSVERLTMLRRILENFEFEDAVQPEWCKSFRKRLVEGQEKLLMADADEVQQTSYAEMKGYLLSTLLRDGDVMSMAHGLEVRPMLLDHPLVEFAYALPAAHKLSDIETKKIFINAVAEFLPEKLRDRPKMGFELPFISWMKGDLKPCFEELLNSESAKKIFRPVYLRSLYSMLRKDRPPRSLWAWGILLSWLEKKRIKLN